MTKRERAAELVDRAERDGFIDVSLSMLDEAAEMRIWIEGLRLLAATPAASSEVRERVARAMAIADGAKDPDALFAPPQTMNSPRDPYPVWMEWLGQADAALAAIAAAKEPPQCPES